MKYHPSMVNAHQSNSERRQKYAYCRILGLNSYQCCKMRGWDWEYIEWFVERWIERGENIEAFGRVRDRVIARRNKEYYKGE